MPSPWTELLLLHGHIADVKLLRDLATLPPSKPPTEPAPNKAKATLTRKTVASLRLCLGIGDGLLRSQ